jgi:hypothetical protein
MNEQNQENQQKDELIAALSEMVQELTTKVVNLRVQSGLVLKAKDREIEELKKAKEPKLKAVD